MKLNLKIFIIILILIVTGSIANAEVINKETLGFEYYIYLPSNYSPEKTYPIVVALHWSTARGTDMIERWREPADKMGYIFVCPNSHNQNYWDIQVEDKDILRMIKEISKDYAIQKNRIFVTGFSAGGTYALYLGLSYPEIFAAAAPFAGSLRWLMNNTGMNLANVSKQIPICLIHGTNDITVDIKESYFAQSELLKYGFKAVIKEVPGVDHQYPAYVSWTIIKWFDRQ
jgi:phospholipase/carboxylesterase